MIELKNASSNYAAFVVEANELRSLAGLDNLRALNVAGYQALVSKDTREGDRFVAFVAGAQISESFAKGLNLHRDASLNVDPEQTGYLEANRRVKAIRLRGHASNLLLVPVGAFGVDFSDVHVGTRFDHINGVELVRKFVVPTKASNLNGKAVKVHKSGVTSEQFPEHYDTPQWWRVQDQFEGRDVTVTQKQHGCSLRAGWVEIDRPAKWYERLASKVGIKPDLRVWKFVVGSRRVIKTEGDGDHWYSTDIWTEYAKTHRLAEALPKGVIVYGELIGWTPDGSPIQPNYTYNLPVGQADLYIYRVVVNGYDLSDAAMREFAAQRGLKVVPLLASFSHAEVAEGCLADFLELYTDAKFFSYPRAFREHPVPLSEGSPCDEGVVIRAEGITPKAAKAKFPRFYEHEEIGLSKGEADIESVEDAAS